MKMSKTAALKAAQNAVSKVIRRSSTDYVVYAPYYSDKPNGPSTELQASTYPQAVIMRSEKVADIALSLMGVYDTFSDDMCIVGYIVYKYGHMPPTKIVDRALTEIL